MQSFRQFLEGWRDLFSHKHSDPYSWEGDRYIYDMTELDKLKSEIDEFAVVIPRLQDAVEDLEDTRLASSSQQFLQRMLSSAYAIKSGIDNLVGGYQGSTAQFTPEAREYLRNYLRDYAYHKLIEPLHDITVDNEIVREMLEVVHSFAYHLTDRELHVGQGFSPAQNPYSGPKEVLQDVPSGAKVMKWYNSDYGVPGRILLRNGRYFHQVYVNDEWRYPEEIF